MNSIVQIMKKYDFSEMETLVYTTLLSKGILTGYEVSKHSGVPRSKVYNILEKLLKKNLIIVNKSEPKLYHAVSSDEFLESLEKNVNQDLLFLTNQLGQIKEQEEEELLWKLDNYQSVMQKVEHLVKAAQSSLLIQIWVEELNDELIGYIREAEERLSQVVVVLFSEEKHYDLGLTHYYIHGFEDEKKIDFGSRWLNVVADEKEVVFGTMSDDHGFVDMTWTKNKAMVNLAKEYVKHDAYTLKIIQELPDELVPKYGTSFEKIRAIYKGDDSDGQNNFIGTHITD